MSSEALLAARAQLEEEVMARKNAQAACKIAQEQCAHAHEQLRLIEVARQEVAGHAAALQGEVERLNKALEEAVNRECAMANDLIQAKVNETVLGSPSNLSVVSRTDTCSAAAQAPASAAPSPAPGRSRERLKTELAELSKEMEGLVIQRQSLEATLLHDSEERDDLIKMVEERDLEIESIRDEKASLAQVR
jgi:hypothetical protein